MNSFNDNDQDGPTLRQLAASACKKIDVGSAVMPAPLFRHCLEDYDGSEELRDIAANSITSTLYASVLEQEFNAIVVEHHLKWAPLCTEPFLKDGKPADRLGRYDFHLADSMVDWGLERGMKVKGHVLVWAVTSPMDVLKNMSPDEVRIQLKRHIFTTMGHFRGRIKVWDVVNEPLAPDGSLADNVFLQKLGPSYIEESFRWAHEADPTATLILNENKVEGVGTVKSERFYEMIRDLKDAGVPIHGCGLQAHFNAAGTGRQRPPTPRMVKQQIQRLGELGVTVNISEMDVRISQLPANLQQIAQRQIYHDIVTAALSEPAFDGLWLWGFTDRHTWVQNFYYDDEPLIFDEDYGRKEAYYGLRDALTSLNQGGRVGGETFLEADVDIDGNPWGHLWMQPEPESSGLANSGESGDARPDWEQPSDAGDTEREDDEVVGVVASDDDSDDVTDDADLSRAANNGPPPDLPPIS